MTNEPSEEEAAARRDDARNPDEAAATVAKFTGSGVQPPAGSRQENYQQLKDAGVDDATLAAVIRGKEGKAQGHSR